MKINIAQGQQTLTQKEKQWNEINQFLKDRNEELEILISNIKMDYLLEKNQLEEKNIELRKEIKIYAYKIDSLKKTIDDHNKSLK